MAAATTFDPAESIWCRRLPLVITASYVVVAALYILFSDRLVLLTVADPERLTAIQTIKGLGFVLLTGLLLYVVTSYGVKRLREAERAGGAADEQFRQMIETTNEGVWLLDQEGRTTSVNTSMARLLHYEPSQMQGRPIAEFVHPEFRRTIEQQLERRRDGEPSQYECRLLTREGESVWVIVTSTPLRDSNDAFSGSLKMVTDITQRKAAEDALRSSLAGQRQLLNELDHRVRNNLSSVLSLLQLARSTAPEAETFAEAVSGRVKAMGRAYSMLSASGWAGQELRRLIDMLLPGEVADRVSLSGKSVIVPAHQIGALALLVHELVTNATEHGSLAGQGCVEVSWSTAPPEFDAGGHAALGLALEWSESRGEPITAEPTLRSGCRLIEGLCRSDLRGSATLRFPREGARHSFQMMLVGSRPRSSAVSTASA